jgi:hypothetical protein
MTNLYHFYHVYADGAWRKPLGLHLAALKHTGLLHSLSGFYVGIVGKEENREDVKEVIPATLIAEEDKGWEQVTLEVLHDFAAWNDGKIFYAHSKGAWNDTDLSKAWRESMTYDCIVRWRECVNALDLSDAAGPFWLKSNEPEHREHDYFFAGNYWWANASYIRRLPPVKNDTRYQAEGWIGMNEAKVTVMRHGLSYWGNFAEPRFNFEPIDIP